MIWVNLIEVMLNEKKKSQDNANSRMPYRG